MASTASTASVASMTYTTSFHQKNDWYWWLDHSWHHNDQYLSLIVEWILENPIFHWYLVPFLSEAVEASPCYFFQNWLMKLKCPNLLKPLDTIIQENCQPFYPSEPFRILRFQMRHPVVENQGITTTPLHSGWDWFITHVKLGHSMDNGFIFKKINKN